MEPGKADGADAPDRIVETFANRKIMVTGGTGFLGKVMLEKFLRCLPEIAQIYMLIRLKKGKDPKHRLLEILNSPVSFSCCPLLALSKTKRAFDFAIKEKFYQHKVIAQQNERRRVCS